jgi:putative DNA primase/helicase
MVQASVNTYQRFRKWGIHCPICGGHAGVKQGIGERCAGFVSDDGEYIFCTREQLAGKLELDERTQPASYCHKFYGLCNCGVIHNPERASNGHKSPHKAEQPKNTTEFPYYNEQGELVYVTVRSDFPDGSKDFKQKRKDKGRWVWNITGVTRILYRLPEIVKASPERVIYICEGEKAVEAARRLGVLATTNVGGAGNWTESCNKSLKGRHVVILPDHDDKGRDHANKVAKQLAGIAASVRIVELPDLPEKGDIVEWIAAGGTREKLEALCTPLKRKFLYASEVQPEAVDYLWTKRLAKGMFTLLAGDPGVSKSLLCTAIAAETTKGSRLPDGKVAAPGGVIIMAPEDSYEHTVIPRLKAAGADLSKIILLSEVPDFDSDGNPYNRPISFPEDAAILEEAIIECKASLAIIDPVLAMVNGKYDTHKDQESRTALSQVLAVAKRQHCAILGVFHLNKAQNGNALYRSTASIAFIAMARIGLFLVPDPQNPENGRVLVNHKNNLAAKATSLRYIIEQTPDEIAYITWNGASELSEQELLGGTIVDNPKSEQETSLLEVLKEAGEAMTPTEIYKKLSTGQSFDALRQMLGRKVEQGVLIQPYKGRYTYSDNPMYAKSEAQVKTDVTNVTNVTTPDSESDARSEAAPSNCDICDICDMPSASVPLPSRMTICCNVPFQRGPTGAPECSNPDCPEKQKRGAA